MTNDQRLISRFRPPKILVVVSVFPVRFNFLIAADLVSAFLAEDLRKINIVFVPVAVDHLDAGQVFMDRLVGQVGMAEGAKHIDVFSLSQPEGMVDDHIIFAQLWVEEDQAACARRFAGSQDHFGIGHQVATAIGTKKIVCFHGDWK